MLRVIGVLTVLAAVVIGVGFFAGWFSFASETHAGETQVRLRIDRDEIRGDVGEIKERLNREESSTPDSVASAAPAGKLTGEVLRIAAPESTVTLRLTSGEERTLVVAAASKAALARLRVGDRVEAATVVEGDRTRIVELEVL